MAQVSASRHLNMLFISTPSVSQSIEQILCISMIRIYIYHSCYGELTDIE